MLFLGLAPFYAGCFNSSLGASDKISLVLKSLPRVSLLVSSMGIFDVFSPVKILLLFFFFL